MGINWTPWFDVPLHRRLEVLCIGIFTFTGIFGALISFSILFFFVFAGNIYMKAIAVLYIVFYCYDINCGDRGGRGAGISWMKSLPIWKYCMNYFPIDLVKTIDLTSDRNYLVCIFPHGISSIGAAGNFCTNHSKWSTYFPGIRPRLATVNFNTQIPLTREVLLNCGIAAATENSLTTLLGQSNDVNDSKNRNGFTSNAVGLVLGGVREVFYTYPNTYRCVVAKRRGFIRIALKTGASLVPAISFGENDLYDIIEFESGIVCRFLEFLCKRFSNVAPIIYCGRGFLQYNFGFIQKRHPVTTVIGAPIHLIKNENPTDNELNKIHDLFCTQLKELFEAHKHKYIEHADKVHLEIV